MVDSFEELLQNGLSAEKALNELMRQLEREKKLKYKKNERLKFRKKFVYAYIFLLLTTLFYSFLGIYYYSNSSSNPLFSILWLIIMIGNGYVYNFFNVYYLEEKKEDISKNENNIENLYIQINVALAYLNIEKEEFYRKTKI